MKDLERFGLTEQNISSIDERTTLIKKWDWDYGQAHQFQRELLELIAQTPQQRFIICCSHPRVFTYGRGLQKPRKGEELDLKDFDLNLAADLPFPFYKIERGGGLTFHYPGQMIIYPILRLNPTTLSLSTMIDELFQAAVDILQLWGVSDLSHHHKLLGLWAGNRKIASMGIAIEKLTTFHGMALNFYHDHEMMRALSQINPCGLEAKTYTAVEDLIDLKNRNLNEFADQYIRRFSHGRK
jgi:lipoyl(octanoyl) transferase